MRKYLVLLTVCIYSIISNAQNVGIGVPNPQNKLHVGGGFRLDTLTGVGGAGLLWHNPNGVVYGLKYSGNTNEVLRGDGTFGPYNPAINGALGWLLTGNSGTNSATNFLGTTDNQPLSFRLNNAWAGQLNHISRNYGIGAGALQSNTTGNQNVGLGNWALLSNTTGSANTSVGNDALSRNTTGNSNTAVGNWALLSNRGGERNTAIGDNALSRNQGGNGNTAIGYWALLSVSSDWNTAVGSGALFANEAGIGNTATGYEALLLNKSSRNSAFGQSALRQNTDGFFNSAFGAEALLNNTTGDGNTAMGHSALSSTQTAVHSTAIGYKSLFSNRANFNTGVGANSLEKNQFGTNNTAVGEEALFNNISGSDNVAIGAEALSNNIIGDHNTAIGFGANVLSNNLTNATAIGANAQVGVSNAMVLGGTGAYAVNVGIGNRLPQATLHVRGSAKIFAGNENHSGNFWNGTSNFDGFEVTSSGTDAYVGIQRGSGAGLHISKPVGTSGPLAAFFVNSAVVGSISTNGTNTAYNTTSDFRLKENRRATQYNLKTLMQIEAEDYNYISDHNKKAHTGFIAQELFKIYPQAVTPGGDDPKTKPWMIDYSKLSPLLVRAVQEQQAIIENQQKQLDDLIKRIEALEKK